MPDESSQEKTEEATPHRKEEALKKGNVVHSREVVSAVTVLLMLLALPVLQPLFVNSMTAVFRESFRFHEIMPSDIATLRIVLFRLALSCAPVLGVVFLLVVFAGVVANVMQVGWRISTEKLEPKLEKLSPAKNIEKVVGRKAAAEAVRTVLKFLIVGVITAITLEQKMPVILGMHRVPPEQFIPQLAGLVWALAWRVVMLMIVLAVLDYVYTRWDWNRRLRMSRQELKEELKEREGNPLIKQRVRSIQMEQARQRMMAEVPGATAVVTNPTHCAVAIRYRPGVDPAPKVVAKGIDHLAQRIKAVAREAGVPCVEDRPMAWALYRGVKIGAEVPAHLYRAVAEILAYVFRLGGWERVDRVRRSLNDTKRGES